MKVSDDDEVVMMEATAPSLMKYLSAALGSPQASLALEVESLCWGTWLSPSLELQSVQLASSAGLSIMLRNWEETEA